MGADVDHPQDADDIHSEDDTDATEHLVPRTPLQAAIVWIMTRNSELTFSLAETELAKIDELILRAGLASDMPTEKAWLELRDAVSDGRIAMWGQKFELPANFELGDVWPRGSQRRLTASDLSNTCLIDIGGMAVLPEGMIATGQTWLCRI
jgi:hypothetical protein